MRQRWCLFVRPFFPPFNSIHWNCLRPPLGGRNTEHSRDRLGAETPLWRMLPPVQCVSAFPAARFSTFPACNSIRRWGKDPASINLKATRHSTTLSSLLNSKKVGTYVPSFLITKLWKHLRNRWEVFHELTNSHCC